MNGEMMNEVRAAIDIGTNTTRLLVAEIKNGKTKELHREANITRLGQDVDENKKLDPEAINRTIKVLVGYKKLVKWFKVQNTIVGATSASRDAKNVSYFIEQVKNTVGLDINVLTAEEEAKLSFKGATTNQTLDPRLQTLVLDIGGGSTELILGEKGKKEPSLFFSKDIGALRLTELFVKNDPPHFEEIKQATEFIKQAYCEAIEKIKEKVNQFQMIGTAGTVTTLAAINLGLDYYDRQKVHCSTLSLSSVENIFDELKKMTVAGRKDHKLIEEGRADVILMGTLILARLMKMLNVKNMIVSEFDILDGLLRLTDEDIGI